MRVSKLESESALLAPWFPVFLAYIHRLRIQNRNKGNKLDMVKINIKLQCTRINIHVYISCETKQTTIASEDSKIIDTTECKDAEIKI